MNLPLTYGQCLRKIIQNNQLSVNTLCRKMGYRSATQLTRILNDEVSPTLITKFHHQFMLIFDWLISPAEIRELSTSLQYSCLGQDAFLTRRAMHRMLFERAAMHPEAVSLRIHASQPDEHCTLQDLFRSLHQYKSVELLILGSTFDALLPMFSAIPKRSRLSGVLHIRHYFVMEEHAAQLISRVSALTSFLSTHMYEGAYCTEASPKAVAFLTQNQIALVRAAAADGTSRTTLLLSPQKDGVPLCRLEDDTLFRFYEQQLSLHLDQMRPVKTVYPKPKTIDSLLTLCQRDLFLEKNRTCCFVRLDLCFHALPANVVVDAAAGGARLGLAPEDPTLLELIRVQEERYRNLLTKKEPTYFILSRPAMAAFAQTGHMSDHLFAMRNFTPAERKAVIAPLVQAMRAEHPLHIHFLHDDTLTPANCFSAYQDMGVQISANNTAYNVAEDHSEVFIGLPDFEESFRSYCINTLIPEFCLPREESIVFLTRLLSELDAMENA